LEGGGVVEGDGVVGHWFCWVRVAVVGYFLIKI
jgi:hypothetical protein